MKKNIGLILAMASLISISIAVLRSIAPSILPQYYMYIFLGIIIFIIFLKIDFEIISVFSIHLYILSLFLLLLPLIIGQVTRGSVRWINIGPYTIQPSEIVRPFLLVFFANFLSDYAGKKLQLKKLIRALILLAMPLILILFQPSLGVAVLTAVGFLGIILSLNYNKRLLLGIILLGVLSLPLIWFLLAPYQKLRVQSLISPEVDPYGAGYNSIQSMISVGSGGVLGRGLGRGIQSQLMFLPERHTDFIFAAIAEELGLVGAGFVLVLSFYLLYSVLASINNVNNIIARSFVSGVFLMLFVQVITHIGMNMGLFPITGLPLPLVSAGGSSLMATMAMLGMVANVRK